MLADHLGSGDYAITRAVFVGILIQAVGAAAWSVFVAKSWTRAIGLVVASILAFAAVRMHLRWEQVTGTVDLMTGPTGGEFRLSELDDVARTVFGSGAVLLVLCLLLVVLIVGAFHGRKLPAPSPSSTTQS